MSDQPLLEKIAIVGAGCRFPGGVNSLDEYWRLLRDGVDAVGELPPGRWDNNALFDADRRRPGTTYVRRGAFLADVDGFDPEFFGISPREAASLDPQHRLLLETSWEALENAGIAAATLRGSNTGVFVGIGQPQYGPQELYAEPARIGPYSGTGVLLSFASGRLSHVLGVHGPSLSVDTACSSSLVALHLACTSLARGECDLALVAGVHLHLTPHVTLFLSRLGVLAPDGRSKAFDAAADGFGRGEGCGVVVVKRLADSLPAGDPVLAVVSGSAINHDGPSSGLTVPSAAAQEKVIRAALASGGIAPDAVGYVETHGTGTRLGDPIEAEALANVFGRERSPLALGAVKSSIGHLEAAAGLASLLKAVLVLRHQRFPPLLSFTTPNPDIPWTNLPFVVPTRATAPAKPLCFAGVSSFGMSGTNAHVVLERAPSVMTRTASVMGPAIIAISAHNAAALDELVRRTSATAEALPAGDFASFCASTVRDRSPLRHRVAFAAADLADARTILAALARDGTHLQAARGEASPGGKGPIAFLFTGQGAQRIGAARRLYACEPVFRAEIDRCATILEPLIDVPLPRLLLDEIEPDLLRRTSLAQPALFALEWALAALWRRWGVQPDMVLGHSLGEYAAACVAGCFSLEDGLALVAERARLMQSIARNGAMAAVRLEADRLAPAVARYGGTVEIAARNAPRATVVSGNAEAIDDLLARFAREGVMAQRLDVSHAFHCRHLDPILPGLRQALAKVRFRPPAVELVSNLTGAPVDAAMLCDPDYWCRATRNAVRFTEGMAYLARSGVSALVEVGPAPVLTALGRQSLPGYKALWLPSMVPENDDALQMRRSLAALFATGFDADLVASLPPETGRVALPTYPFQRRPIRLPAAPPAGPVAVGSRTMPGTRLALPMNGETRFELTVPAEDALLAEHRLFDEVIVPAAWHVALICTAVQSLHPSPGVALEDITFVQPARLPSSGLVVQLVLQAQREGRARFRLVGRAGDADAFDEGSWQTHVTGTALLAAPSAAAMPLPPADGWCPSDGLYKTVEAAGFVLGPSFRWASQIGGEGDSAEASLAEPPASHDAPGARIPVGLLDSCFQLMCRFWPTETKPAAFVPFRIGRFALFARPDTTTDLFARATRDAAAMDRGNSPAASVTLLSPDGTVLAAAEEFVFRSVTRGTPVRPPSVPLRVPVWRPVAGRAPSVPQDCTIVACSPDLSGAATYLATTDAADACVSLLQAMRNALDAAIPGRLVLATHGAQAAGRPHRIALVQAALWGFARTLQQEHPTLSFGLVDLDPARAATEQWDELLQAASGTEPQLALRDHVLLAPQLDDAAPGGAQAPLDPEGLYLVTGGLGALGLETASWLVERQARHLLLVGRSTPSSVAAERLGLLRSAGVEVIVRQLDVAQAATEQALEDAIAASGRKLSGIVHAAGTLDDGVALFQTRDRIADVLAAKVAGALLLDRLATRHDVRFLILYSSVAAIVGARGQSSYAAANAFLDALAQDRHTRGLPVLSVNWGPWAGFGMAARHPQAATALGLAPMAPAAALEALGRALSSGSPQVEIARRVGPKGIARPAPSPLAPKSTRLQIEEVVRGCLARALGLAHGDAIEARARLFDLGLNSLSALEVRDALEAALDRTLHSTLLFDHPTIEALVDHLTRDRARDSAPADEVPDDIATLSEEEAEEALLGVLERLHQ